MMALVFKNLTKSHPRLSTAVTFVRFYRKPRWIPTAKSKMYRNIELKTEPAQEFQERTRLNDNHRIYCKSLWAWQKQVMEKHSSQNLKDNNTEDMELLRIIRDNDEINVRIKCRRDSELVEEWAEVVKEIAEKRRLMENDVDLRLEIAKKKVLSEMEKLKSVINLDDLDLAIESCLSSEVDYNFAIDESGNVISGGGTLV